MHGMSDSRKRKEMPVKAEREARSTEGRRSLNPAEAIFRSVPSLNFEENVVPKISPAFCSRGHGKKLEHKDGRCFIDDGG